MVINPIAQGIQEFNLELMNFLKSVDAQWYVLCELHLGQIYERHGATLLPNKFVESLIGEELYEKYDDEVSFCRGNDRCSAKKVIVLIPSLTIYENVFKEINLFNLTIHDKQEAIDFIEQFNAWVMGDIRNVDFFIEWYNAIEIAEHYLSIDSTPNDKCLIQLCHYYQGIDNYTYHQLKDIPICYLHTEVDEYGVGYSAKRVLFADKTLKNYVVPDGIEQIDDDAFHGCEDLEHIALPVTLRRIGMNGFCHCDSLQELILPDNVNYIGECLCEHCNSLKRAVLSDKIEHIQIASFYRCDSLEEMKLPAQLRTLSDNVFACTPLLKHLELPDSLFWIGGECFWNVAIEELKIPKHAKIAEDAFLDSKVKIEYI
ncbi:MAG: leucine-rich repeat domain-containing protein [Atopococcus tabaci]|uniref:Leucine-rich repeat domain-containing protein n=1 Tax=Atopococcus tabaci TaxID=269774 RepID=A0AA43ZSM4_9LACT|nr:leucine-rich repeat domain-containing protein [Atopococcus tabaci]